MTTIKADIYGLDELSTMYESSKLRKQIAQGVATTLLQVNSILKSEVVQKYNVSDREFTSTLVRSSSLVKR